MSYHLRQPFLSFDKRSKLFSMMNLLFLSIISDIAQAIPTPPKNASIPENKSSEKSSSDHTDSGIAQDSNENTYNPNSFNDGAQMGPYANGGMPLISDSLFSLVILLYVSISFLFVFFMFCWKSGNSDGTTDQMGSKGTNGNLTCPLISLEDIIGGKRQQDKPQSIMMNILNKEINDEFSMSGIMREPSIIPPTPTPSTPILVSKLPCVNEDIETDEDETTSLTTNGINSSGERI